MFAVHTELGEMVVSLEDQMLWSVRLPELWDSEGRHFVGSNWDKSGSSFVSENANFSCQCIPNMQGCFSSFSFRVVFTTALTVGCFGITQQLHAHNIQFLDRYYRWRTLDSKHEVVDSLTPACLVGHCGHQSIALQFRHHALLQTESAYGKFVVYFDHSSTHPRISHHNGTPPRRDAISTQPGLILHTEASLSVHSSKRHELVPVPWRYPGGKLSCLVITDHADWDTTEKLRVLYSDTNGVSATRIKMTKSVFFGTVGFETPDKSFQPHGLDVPAFAAVVAKLHECGHEVCPHSIVVRQPSNGRHQSRTSIARALDFFAQTYTSGTWIDHGLTEQFNYSQLGWDSKGESYLLDLLRQRGFNNLWSYYDALRYPLQNINLLTAPDTSRDYLRAALRKAFKRELWYSANYAKLAAELRIDPNGKRQIGQLTEFIKIIFSHDFKTMAKVNKLLHRIPKLAKALMALPYSLVAGGDCRIDALFPAIYCERGLSLGQIANGDLVLFASCLVNNIDDSWCHLQTLVNEHGIHIAHTYLCKTDLRYGSSALERKNGEWAISESFSEFLTEIDERIARKEIWNPTMKDCADYFKTWIKINAEPVGPGRIKVTNPTANPVLGYTLLFPPNTRTVSVGERVLLPCSQQAYLYCIDLQPDSSIELTWS